MESFLSIIILISLMLILIVPEILERRGRVWSKIDHPVVNKLLLAGFELRSVRDQVFDFYNSSMDTGVVVVNGGDRVYLMKGKNMEILSSLDELDEDFFNLILKKKF